MEEERPVCLPCQNLLTVMTVAPDRQSGIGLAMGERADAMCGVECYSNAGVVDQVQVQLAGDRGRMHRTNGSSSLLEKVDSLLCCPPSPQPASLEVLKGGFFVERVVPVFFRQIKAPWSILGRQVASRLLASKTKRRKTSSAHTQKLPQWKLR